MINSITTGLSSIINNESGQVLVFNPSVQDAVLCWRSPLGRCDTEWAFCCRFSLNLIGLQCKNVWRECTLYTRKSWRHCSHRWVKCTGTRRDSRPCDSPAFLKCYFPISFWRVYFLIFSHNGIKYNQYLLFRELNFISICTFGDCCVMPNYITIFMVTTENGAIRVPITHERSFLSSY